MKGQKKRRKKDTTAEISRERVLEELARIGFANLMDYLELEENEAGEVTVRPRQGAVLEGAAISEIAITREGNWRLKLYNKLDALEKIGKHLGMFQDGSETRETDASLLEALRQAALGRGAGEERQGGDGNCGLKS